MEVGFGRMGADSIRSALELASLGQPPAPAPARGLYLAHVLYPKGLKVFERYPNDEGE
jgi:tRNA U38,U39,U40 pseudouridine synthase TruA